MDLEKIKNNKNFGEIYRFIIVGIVGNVINYLVFLCFFKLFSINYLISGIIGFVSPLPILFIMNRNWTFKSKVKTTRMSLYIVTNLFGLAVHTFSQYIAFEIIGIPKVFSQLIGQLSSATINFLISKYFVFK